MTLRDSRYAKAELFIDDNGNKVLDWFQTREFDVNDFQDNRIYEIVNGDTVFSVASRFFGEQKYYWVVAIANDIFNPFLKLKPPGTLIIPSFASFTQIIGD